MNSIVTFPDRIPAVEFEERRLRSTHPEGAGDQIFFGKQFLESFFRCRCLEIR